MKRILNKLFSKLVLGGLIIILQFSWFVYLLYSATVYSSMVDALFKIASIVLALFVSSRDMRSTYKTSWIFLILALPLFGIPAYYLFGRPGLTKRTRMKMDVVSSRIRAYSSPSDDVMSALRAEDDSVGQQAQYLTRYAGYPVYREADTQYYCCGEEMYPQFLEDLKTAKSYIFLEYFIAEPGKMLDAIVEILAQKAKEGVDVRFTHFIQLSKMYCSPTLPAGPPFISRLTTYRCNAKCNMCNIWQHQTKAEDEIDPSFYEKLPAGLRINITGEFCMRGRSGLKVL